MLIGLIDSSIDRVKLTLVGGDSGRRETSVGCFMLSTKLPRDSRIKLIVKDSKSGRLTVLNRGENSEPRTYLRDSFPTNRALKQGELPKR